MKKYSLLFIPLLLWGCEKDFDNVIDTPTENYQVSTITYVGHNIPVYDLKNPSDSLLELRIIFTPESEVNKVYFNIYASDNSLLTSTPVEMTEINDNVFQNSFILQEEFPNGIYTVNFSVTGLGGNTKQAAVSSFSFNNGQDNVAPVIFNLVIPDTIARSVSFIFSVTTSDSNGLSDIESVYFALYRPDSTEVEESPFLMHDDGDPGFGDEIAGDGIYSFKNSFAETAPTGNWRFEFQAKDRSNSLSNIINHFVLIQ